MSELEPSRTVSLADLLGTRQVDVVARMALTPEEAAAAIGVSRRFFYEHVLAELRVVRVGRKRLIPVRELQSWLEDQAARAIA